MILVNGQFPGPLIEANEGGTFAPILPISTASTSVKFYESAP